MNFVLLDQFEQFRSEGMIGNEIYFDYQFYDEMVLFLICFVEILYIYYIFVIICFGIFLNIVVCIVFFRMKLRKKFYMYVFVVIIISDNGFLVIVFMIWMKDQVVDIYKVFGMC